MGYWTEDGTSSQRDGNGVWALRHSSPHFSAAYCKGKLASQEHTHSPSISWEISFFGSLSQGYIIPACIYQSPGSKQNSTQMTQRKALSITSGGVGGMAGPHKGWENTWSWQKAFLLHSWKSTGRIGMPSPWERALCWGGRPPRLCSWRCGYCHIIPKDLAFSFVPLFVFVILLVATIGLTLPLSSQQRRAGCTILGVLVGISWLQQSTGAIPPKGRKIYLAQGFRGFHCVMAGKMWQIKDHMAATELGGTEDLWTSWLPLLPWLPPYPSSLALTSHMHTKPPPLLVSPLWKHSLAVCSTNFLSTSKSSHDDGQG